MKKTLLFGLTVIAALVLGACKSKESAYKKAYEKAKAAETSYTTTAQNVQGIYNNPQTVVTPTTTTTPTTDFDNTYSYSNTNTSNNNYSNTNTYSNSNNNYNNDNYSTSNVLYCEILQYNTFNFTQAFSCPMIGLESLGLLKVKALLKVSLSG